MAKTLVIGLGEIGKPLMNLLSRSHDVVGKDIEPLDLQEPVEVMHICYPYEIGDFVGTTVEYIRQYKPSLVIINSTVVPGTSRQIQEQVEVPVVYSPIKGKHWKMEDDLLYYPKFVAGFEEEAAVQAGTHFLRVGMKVRLFKPVEGLELAKLIETTYFGLLIAWAQEVERLAKQVEADYYDVMSFTEGIPYLPPQIFTPGYIGGHCVIPNIHLLLTKFQSKFFDAILDSNYRKALELGMEEALKRNQDQG